MTTTPEPAKGMPLYQINQTDLEELERMLPNLTRRLWPDIDNPTKVQIRTVKRIVSDVRWGYGPPEQCERIEG